MTKVSLPGWYVLCSSSLSSILVCLLLLGIYSVAEPIWIDLNFSNWNACMPSLQGIFQIDTSLSVVFSMSMCTLAQDLLPVLLILFSCYLSTRFFYSVLSVLLSRSKVILFLLLIYPSDFSTDLLVEFHFVILEGPVLFMLLDPVPISFESPFFANCFLIYFF